MNKIFLREIKPNIREKNTNKNFVRPNSKNVCENIRTKKSLCAWKIFVRLENLRPNRNNLRPNKYNFRENT